MKHNFLNYIPVICIRLVAKIPAKFMYGLAWVGAKLVALSKLNIKYKTKLNLKIAFPELQEAVLNRHLFQAMHHLLYSAYEISRVWCSPLKKLKQQILTVHGEEILKMHLDNNRPVILLCPHLGCWEMVGYWVNSIGYNISILYKPMSNPCLDDFMIQARAKGGNEIVPVTAKGVKKIYQDLKNKKMVGILPDQVPQEESSYMMSPFFSEDAATMTLIHTLCSRTNSSVVFITAVRESYKGFHIHIQSGEEIIDSDVRQSTMKMNKGIEKLIEIAPDQYQWSYSRYRYNPSVDYKQGMIKNSCVVKK